MTGCIMLELDLFVIFVTSLMFTFAVIPLIVRFASTYGLYDYPDLLPTVNPNAARRIHTRPIPRLGGLGIVTGFFLSMLIWVSPLPLRSIFFISMLMFTVGVVDDLRPLSAKSRLVLQCLFSGLIVWHADLGIEYLRLTESIQISVPNLAGVLLSTFVVVGAINAINLTDGLDGLAGGVVLIGIVLISMLHFLATQDLGLLLCLSVPLIGSLLGFLRYNTHPATIFMGDGGSNWLGFMIGIFIVLVLNGATLSAEGENLVLNKAQANIPFISAIMCLAVPIVDTAFVMIRRLASGKKIMAPDRGHFHHTLMKIGLSHPQSVVTIYFLALVTGTLGLMPVAYSNYELSWVPYLGGLGLVLVIPLSIRFDSVVHARILGIRDQFFVRRKSSPFVKKTIRALDAINRYLIYSILALAPLLGGVPHKGIGYSAVAGLCLLVIAIFASDRQNFFQSFVISITASILLTAINFNTLAIEFMGRQYFVQFIYNATFVTLLLTTLIYLFLTARSRSLVMTPTDFLMVCLPLMFLFVPEPYQTEFRFNIISLRSLVLFVSIRALTRSHTGVIRRIRVVCMIGLIYVSLTALCGFKIIY
jgi:UDP-GlcNAc:undecaprenyl-phosphate GlcNAc-1-phosphate transferase